MGIQKIMLLLYSFLCELIEKQNEYVEYEVARWLNKIRLLIHAGVHQPTSVQLHISNKVTCKIMIMLLLCSMSHNDVTPASQRNISMATVQRAACSAIMLHVMYLHGHKCSA